MHNQLHKIYFQPQQQQPIWIKQQTVHLALQRLQLHPVFSHSVKVPRQHQRHRWRQHLLTSSEVIQTQTPVHHSFLGKAIRCNRPHQVNQAVECLEINPLKIHWQHRLHLEAVQRLLLILTLNRHLEIQPKLNHPHSHLMHPTIMRLHQVAFQHSDHLRLHHSSERLQME